METLLHPPLAGRVLPARYSLPLGAPGVIVLMTFAVYGNTTFAPCAGDA